MTCAHNPSRFGKRQGNHLSRSLDQSKEIESMVGLSGLPNPGCWTQVQRRGAVFSCPLPLGQITGTDAEHLPWILQTPQLLGTRQVLPLLSIRTFSIFPSNIIPASPVLLASTCGGPSSDSDPLSPGGPSAASDLQPEKGLRVAGISYVASVGLARGACRALHPSLTPMSHWPRKLMDWTSVPLPKPSSPLWTGVPPSCLGAYGC
jgi:hypothetical protein